MNPLKHVAISTIFATTSILAEPVKVPKIWDDAALKDWALPIAALGVRPGHFTSAEYYAVPGENSRTYPVYHPDREPSGYWEWLKAQKPAPLVDAQKLRTKSDWIDAGRIAFRDLEHPLFRITDPAIIAKYRDPGAFENVFLQPDGTLIDRRWVVTHRRSRTGKYRLFRLSQACSSGWNCGVCRAVWPTAGRQTHQATRQRLRAARVHANVPRRNRTADVPGSLHRAMGSG